MDIVIYHNPDCGTSRNTLAMIRNAGIEPHVIDYLKCPPSRVLLEGLIARMGIAPRDLLREKGTPHAELGLGDPSLSDDALLDAMMAHPILINRTHRGQPERGAALPPLGTGAGSASAAESRL